MAEKKKKAKPTLGSRLKKGSRPPEFVTIKQGNKCTHVHFPVAAHPVEKRLMGFYLLLTLTGFGAYFYTKPETAILTEGLIPYQIAAFLIGCIASVKFTSLLLSRFYIKIGKLSIDMHYGPLAKRRLKILHVQRIEQIYVDQVETLLGFKYQVQAITKNKREHTIYVTYHSRLAKYLEYMLEDFMGIKDKPVKGEYGGSGQAEEEYL